VRRRDKQRENEAAAQVLGDLLRELDDMPPRWRLLALVQGVLAGNIFDWGAQARFHLWPLDMAGCPKCSSCRR
jgi:bifunctional damage-control phosphatase, subfamily II, fusion protein